MNNKIYKKFFIALAMELNENCDEGGRENYVGKWNASTFQINNDDKNITFCWYSQGCVDRYNLMCYSCNKIINKKNVEFNELISKYGRPFDKKKYFDNLNKRFDNLDKKFDNLEKNDNDLQKNVKILNETIEILKIKIEKLNENFIKI